jgi:hypothetical protein
MHMKSLMLQLAKYLLRLTLDEKVRNALPDIYKRLDAEVPLLLANNATPPAVKGAIAAAISSVTNQCSTTEQIEAVIALYDPVKAARTTLIASTSLLPDAFRP